MSERTVWDGAISELDRLRALKSRLSPRSIPSLVLPKYCEIRPAKQARKIA
jgi:hypothetical protein